MTHSITTDVELAFRQGIVCFDQGVTKDNLDFRVNSLKSLGGPYVLLAMAYYDGYIRRKHGLVDENGEEIFR